MRARYGSHVYELDSSLPENRPPLYRDMCSPEASLALTGILDPDLEDRPQDKVLLVRTVSPQDLVTALWFAPAPASKEPYGKICS